MSMPKSPEIPVGKVNEICASQTLISSQMPETMLFVNSTTTLGVFITHFPTFETLR